MTKRNQTTNENNRQNARNQAAFDIANELPTEMLETLCAELGVLPEGEHTHDNLRESLAYAVQLIDDAEVV